MFGALGLVGDPFSLQAYASAQNSAIAAANFAASQQATPEQIARLWANACNYRLPAPPIPIPSTWAEWSALMSAEPMGNP